MINFVFLLVLALQNNPNSPPKQSIACQQQTVQTQPCADTQNKQTPAPEPPIIKDQTSSAKQDETTQQHAEEVRIQRQMLYVAIVLAGAGILQFIILLLTFWIMRDTARRQLRAYIGISSASLMLIDKNTFVVGIGIKNYGQTPAYDVRHFVKLRFSKYPLSVTLLEPPDSDMGSEGIIASGSEPFTGGKIDRNEGASGDYLFIYGKVVYKDIFKKPRWTKFRYIFPAPGKDVIPTLNKSELLTVDSGGNKAK